MLDLQILKQTIIKIEESIKEIEEILKIDTIKKRIYKIKEEQEDPNFFQDIENAKKLNTELKSLENKLNDFFYLQTLFQDINAATELLEFNDEELEKEIENNIKKIQGLIEDFEIKTLLNGQYDLNNAYITLHSGAGGVEAQDWVDMLYRMYLRYADKEKFKVEEIDKIIGDVAGIKSITFKVIGENAYGYLKSEKGVHRLVRISPFDSKSRRHTSFASVEVFPELNNDNSIEIKQEELKIDTYRSSGAGGQHVNKTESAIRITHIPSGIVVQCQNERSQIQNRERAIEMLISKLAELKERENEEKTKSIKGKLKKIEWGSQIRSYVFCPYTMVKDHRTDYETSNLQHVMDGDISRFIKEYLKGLN